jgi:hypothetical protein
MTLEAIAASWATRGPIARAARFRIVEDDGRLDLIADASGVGRLLRAFRSLPLNAPGEDIEAALDGLYVDLGGAERAADVIKGRSFAEHLAQE